MKQFQWRWLVIVVALLAIIWELRPAHDYYQEEQTSEHAYATARAQYTPAPTETAGPGFALPVYIVTPTP